MFQESLPNNPIVASPIDFPKIVFPIDFKDRKAIYCLKFDFKHQWYMEQNICTKSEASRGKMNF